MKACEVLLVVLAAGGVGACEDRRDEHAEPFGAPENVGQAPAAPTHTVEEPNPDNVPKAEAPEPFGPAPTAGTTPNTPAGKNQAPPPDTTTGAYKDPSAEAQGRTRTEPAPFARDGEPSREAEARFETVKGIELAGDAKFEEVSSGVRVKVKVEDAPPGKRGIHIHARGDCSDIAGKSMGSHFAPEPRKHGLPKAQEHHLGDLGNITIAQDGSGTLDIMVPEANLKKDDRLSLLGKALVIHQSEDRGTQPTGDSGSPIACAVIEKE